MTTEITIPTQGTDVQRLVDALNAARLVGIKFTLSPNPHIRWDDLTAQWTPATTDIGDTFPTTWEGGHALVIEYGDCEFYGRCQCGKDLGMVTPDRFRDDVFGGKWERHVMTELPR